MVTSILFVVFFIIVIIIISTPSPTTLCSGLERFGGGASSEPRRVCRVGRRVGNAGHGSAV
jgi:hypothetical protein